MTSRAGVRPPSPGGIARRHAAVTVAKLILPAGALALLSLIALWPEVARDLQRERMIARGLSQVVAASGKMMQPRYRGRDERDRPFMVSADTAKQAGAGRVTLEHPQGDATLQNGTWVDVRARHGTFIEHAGQLDLVGDVTLYRQDGTTLSSDTATMDLKRGAGTSDRATHAEGPFGTLDAQGFTLVDKGGVVQFRGPARLVLNSGK